MPPTPEPPAHITIKVKVPPGYLSTTDNASGTDSFSLGDKVPVIANIGNLRQQIQQIIPTHPAPERQRLLYGGRALVDNEQSLAEAFNVKRDPTQTEYVVHLLVKGEQGMGDGQPAHRRAVSTPPAQAPQQPGNMMPGTQVPLQQGLHGQPGVPPGARRVVVPPQILQQQQFPQIIARNQQMRAGMGMQGVNGQQGQQQADGHAGHHAIPGQQPHQAGQAGQAPGQGQSGHNLIDGNGQPRQSQQHPHVPGRPMSGQGFHLQGVGPNGQRFQIHHHQQMMQLPMAGMGGGMPGQVPLGFPGMPQFPGMMPGMGFPQPHMAPGQGAPQQANGPSALDRARENVAEMRRVLEDMRNQNGASEEQRQQLENIQQRAQALNDYIDPLQVRGAPTGQQQSPLSPTVTATQGRASAPPPLAQGMPPLFTAPRRPTVPTNPQIQQHFARPSNPNEVTAYLLSSPQGPQALLFSPQHGTYTGSFAANARPQPTPTTGTQAQPTPTTQPPQGHQDPQEAQAAQNIANQLQAQGAQLQAAQANNGQAAPANPEANGPLQALLGHFWLLLRILIFAYFLLGSNMGWQRPLLLLGIGMTFWMVRAGALGDGAAVRRWWEDVVGVEPARRAQPDGQAGQQQGGQQPARGQGQAQQQQQGGLNGRQTNGMPTPEQVAQRLLNERQQQHGWLREQLRPVERAVALFVASLWPGVGEATVRARREMEERAERERSEAEVERRRREEEENGREGGEKKEGERKEGVGEGSGGKEEMLSGEKEEGGSSAVAVEGAEGLRERTTGTGSADGAS